MINLLKNQRLESSGGGKNGKPGEINANKPKNDLSSYQDSEGITISKLNFGLWWVENRQKLVKILMVTLSVIGIITWSLFFYTFGEYIIFGMQKDNKMLQELANGSSINHQLVKALSAKDLSIIRVKQFNNNELYDYGAEILNPNKNFFVEFDFSFSGSGRQTEKKHGFILPGEKKYFFALGEKQSLGSGAIFNLGNIKWTRIDTKIFPDWNAYKDSRLNISTSEARFIPSGSTVLSEKLNLNEIKFKINNNTIFNYWAVGFKILLLSRGEIEGINEYTVSNLLAGESREVSITWPGKVGYIDYITIIPDLDITDSRIYLNYTAEASEEK